MFDEIFAAIGFVTMFFFFIRTIVIVDYTASAAKISRRSFSREILKEIRLEFKNYPVATGEILSVLWPLALICWLADANISTFIWIALAHYWVPAAIIGLNILSDKVSENCGVYPCVRPPFYRRVKAARPH